MFIMALPGQHILFGIITDGFSWHCIQFASTINSTKMNINKYFTFTTKEDQIISIVPEALKLL